MKLKPFDRQIYKYSPDQMILRLNQIVDTINGITVALMVTDKDSKTVIITGQQPDGSFGVKKWTKNGDNYTFISGVL